MRRLAPALVLVTLAAAAAALPASASAKTTWLCRPGLAKNPCTASLATTAVAASGKQTVSHPKAARHPAVDCFYVYPTVSNQKTKNANLHVDPEETYVASLQVSRFSRVCRIYAPMYRQVTRGGLLTAGTVAAATKAYADVRSAWRQYLARDNHGRGVVLIGHSQGTAMLIRLIRGEIDASRSKRRRLVSALLIGGNVVVAKGKRTGGDFAHVPTCRTATAPGCIVAFSTFDTTPPAGSLFGRPRVGVSFLKGHADAANTQVACVDPNALLKRSHVLHPVFPKIAAVTTPWTSYPGLYTGRCRSGASAHWLQIDDAPASDPRPRVKPVLGPNWGLHQADMNLTMGDLVDVARTQAKAYVKKHR